jgi:hypothetical protein
MDTLGLVHGGELTDFTKEVAAPLHLGNKQTAAFLIAQRLDSKDPIKNDGQANVLLTSFLQYLLDGNRYVDAATLLWPASLFSGEPESVKTIFNEAFKNVAVMLQGAASMGKSYSLGVYAYLDWRRDPQYTNYQFVGPSEKHLERNLFTHLVKLHNAASVSGPGDVRQLEISSDPKEKNSGLFGVVVPTGKRASGRLQGVKVVPRPHAHPQFGKLSRLRVVLEEAENIPPGIFEDVTNILSNARGTETFKIFAAFNPKDPNSQCAIRSEPPDGWGSLDVERSTVWDSKRGWRVVRLDAYKCENVLKGQEIFFGLQTKEGLDRLIQNAGGVGTPGYYCVDHETEALTQRGWKKYGEVEIGDLVYSLNKHTGFAEWSPVLEVFRAPYSGELVSIEGRSFSALVTSNHRWPVTDKLRIARGTGYAIKTTDQLTKNNLLPLAVRPARFGPDGDIDFAATVGWLVTDGTVQTKDGIRCAIYQSTKANGLKCDLIRGLLVRQGVRFTERVDKTGIKHFRLEAAFSRRLLAVVGEDKRLPLHFIDSLSYEAREALLQACVLGDGGVQGGSTRYVCSKDRELAGAYAYLAASLGFATTTHIKPPRPATFSNGRTHPGTAMFYVDVIGHSHTLVKHNRVEPREYSGIVWCPRTENGTWYARRHGHVYFTGNTMARGWYPPQGVDLAVIPQHLLNDLSGKYEFAEVPKPLAAVDVALEGGDNAILALGRIGQASGWRRTKTDTQKDELIRFTDDLGNPTTKEVIQVDQVFQLPKGDTLKLVSEIRRVVRGADVKGPFLGVDRTGNGAGVHDLLVSQFHASVRGINPSSAPTERKILEEDTKLPCDEYQYLLSELWFGLRKYIEFGLLKIDPQIPQDPLWQELAGRRFLLTGQKTKVESKKDYKSRGNKSPDRADALTMLTFVARLNSSGPPSITGRSAERDDGPPQDAKVGLTDRQEYL